MFDLPMLDTIELSISLGILVFIAIVTLRTRYVMRKRDQRLQDAQRLVLRLESEHRFFLTAGSLGPLHEKINKVAQDVTAISAQQRAQTEQLRIITRHILHQS